MMKGHTTPASPVDSHQAKHRAGPQASRLVLKPAQREVFFAP